VRRHLLGLIALASLVLAAVTIVFSSLSPYQAAAGMALRIGIVLGVLWLAWPDLHRLPRWLWYALPIGIIFFYYARGMLTIMTPVLAGAVFLYIFYRKVWRSPSR
jgi:hypothetical protein